MPNYQQLALLLLCTHLGGCGVLFSGAKIETAKTVTSDPSDIRVYVSVEDKNEPVSYLNKNNFTLRENGVSLDSEEVGLVLLSSKKYAAGHTVLLLDLSGSPNKAELKGISRGAAHFVEKVSTTQGVTVVAFDGSKRSRKVASYSQVERSTKRPLPPLENFLTKDSSRDLNSALLAAIYGLGQNLKKEHKEMAFGNVVTLVRGPDLAGRITNKEVTAAIEESGYEFFSIAPKELSFGTLSDIGRDKRFTYVSMENLPLRFQDLGMRVRAAWQSHYVISYCSPARAGERKLKVEVDFQNEEGTSREASSSSKFDSTGFIGGCVPADNSSPTLLAQPGANPEYTLPQTRERTIRLQKSRTITGESVQKGGPNAPKTGPPGEVIPPPASGKYE